VLVMLLNYLLRASLVHMNFVYLLEDFYTVLTSILDASCLICWADIFGFFCEGFIWTLFWRKILHPLGTLARV
jgi:hypothetical protein